MFISEETMKEERYFEAFLVDYKLMNHMQLCDIINLFLYERLYTRLETLKFIRLRETTEIAQDKMKKLEMG